MMRWLLAGILPLTFFLDGHAQSMEMLANMRTNFERLDSLGKMEGPFRKGLSLGWESNCYGINSYTFSADSSDVHSGKYAQRISCSKFESGGVQIREKGLSVVQGEYYTLYLWMKGSVETRVLVGLRENQAPYTFYVSNAFPMSNKWEPYMVVGKASRSDTSCGLYIMVGDTGTLLVDDVHVKEGNSPGALADRLPVHKGNLVYNSSFEVGGAGWQPGAGFVVAFGPAVAGRAFAKLGKERIESQPFSTTMGQRYTISAYLRSHRAGVHCSLGMSEWADLGADTPLPRVEIDTTVEITHSWRRYSVTGIAVPRYGCISEFEITSSDSLDVDNVQVEEGELTGYLPKDSVEIGVGVSRPWCFVGDSITYHVSVTSVLRRSFDLSYALTDLWGSCSCIESAVRYYSTSADDSFRIPMNETGMFRFSAEGVGVRAYGDNWVGVFPKSGPQSNLPSRFGTHVAPSFPIPGNALLASKAMGARWVRLHDFGDFCHWYQVEPQLGTYVWHDAEVRQLSSEGFRIIGNLGFPPVWAAKKEPGWTVSSTGWTNSPPSDTLAWKDYVSRTVDHYKGMIHDWEIWNEAYLKGFFTGTPEEYTKLLSIAYRTIKEIDPKSTVIGGCFGVYEEDWTEDVLSDHASNCMDEVSYHQYWGPNDVDMVSVDSVPKIVYNADHLQFLMKKFGGRKPIDITEGGVRSASFDSWVPPGYFPESARSAAATLVKGIAEMLSAGVSKFCYYFSGYNNGAPPWYSRMVNGATVLLDYGGRPKPTMMAYSATAEMLDYTTPIKSIYDTGVVLLLFKKGPELTAVVWGPRSTTISIPATKIFNMMGDQINNFRSVPKEPFFVRTKSLDTESLIKEIRLCY